MWEQGCRSPLLPLSHYTIVTSRRLLRAIFAQRLRLPLEHAENFQGRMPTSRITGKRRECDGHRAIIGPDLKLLIMSISLLFCIDALSQARV